jgi:hypothetical protein
MIPGLNVRWETCACRAGKKIPGSDTYPHWDDHWWLLPGRLHLQYKTILADCAHTPLLTFRDWATSHVLETVSLEISSSWGSSSCLAPLWAYTCIPEALRKLCVSFILLKGNEWSLKSFGPIFTCVFNSQRDNIWLQKSVTFWHFQDFKL